MKKLMFAVMLFLIMLITASCAAKEVNYKTKALKSDNSKEAPSIRFEYFYRGFAAIKEDKEDSYPNGTLVIQTDEDWHDFMDKYVPGIPYNLAVDYSAECLVFSSLFPARPTYSDGADIKTLILNGNKLEAEYISGTLGVSNGIYAQNIDGVVHCFVNIVKVSKKDIPKNIENVYHRK